MSGSEALPRTPEVPDDPIAEWPLPDWDRYLILGHLGAGGAGRVFKAWDPRLRRNVAIKVLHSEDTASMQRFLREARTQAQLTHPNICQVFEADMVEDHPYIIMQLIEGRSLEVAAQDMSVRERAGVLRDIAAALAAAHQVQLIHRDIKPSNIMVERRRDGSWHPYLLDFGLSRNLSINDLSARDDGTLRANRPPASLRADSTVPLELTQLGQVMGTPAYMAPEQARGAGSGVGEASDVFSLGATMYAVLGGRPPFTGATHREVMERVVSDDPAPLRELSRETPGDLAAVVMRCLSKDPNQRYPSAAAVAADLRAFLEGYPVSAVRPTLRYVALKTVTRRPLLTAVLAIVVLAAAAFGGLWVHTRWSAVRQAVVAAKMGHRVAEAKSLLWRARTAPLHDIRPHLAEVRRQMDVIRTEMATAGRTARGTGHLALGEAHLALRELEHAEHHLRTAWSSGYQTPEGAFAMARAVAGQYRDGLSSVEHIRDARLRELRLEEIRSTLGVELVAWWQRTEDRASTPSELLAALVASHEGRIDDALAACSKVLDAAPWMYEAHLIAGDLHLLRAAEEQPLSERWFALIDHARSAFRAAVTLAPSDPSCRIGAARAELFVFERCTAPGQEERILAAVEAGLRATRNALLCNPSQADGWTVRSRLMQAKASLLQRLDEPWHHVIEDAIELAEAAIQLQPAAPSTHQCLGDAWVMKARLGALRGEDVEDDLKEAIASLEKVVGLSPSHTAYHALGIAWRRLASCRIGRGRDGADDALARAAVSFGEALQYRPDNHHTLHNLGRTAHIRGQLAARQGRDPMEHYQRAEANLQRAIATEPTLGIPYNSLGNLQTDIAKWQARCGHDASEALKGAIAAFEQAMLNAPEYAFAANNLADALIFNASLEIDRGRDPSGLLQRADELLDTALTWRPGYATPLFNRGVLERTRARYERLTGGDPLPALGAAAVGLAGGLERRHDVAEAEAMLADIHLERARVLDARKRDVTNAMRLHRRWAETALEHDPLLAAGWRTLLAGALCRAERALDHGPDAQEAIAEAESALREARSIDPSHPALLRSSARLRWLMARSAEEPARRSRLLADGLEQLAPLVDRDTPDPRALLLAARLHRAHPDSREHAEASALIQRALAINPLLATDASTVHD